MITHVFTSAITPVITLVTTHPSWVALGAAQAVAMLVLLHRMLPGRTRLPPVQPAIGTRSDAVEGSGVSVIVATLNEAARITPCLEGLAQQGSSMLEVLVVDSNSTDGTRALVQEMAARDPRFRLVSDSPLPTGWVGKVWALETGLHLAKGEWILGIDADTAPQRGMVDAIVRSVREQRYDAASFGPRFAGQTRAERWVQPAMLITLIYRTGAAGAEPPPSERVLANGQCFVVRRELLLREGGYATARASFSDDVTLARHLARRGARVGFLDGSKIIDVRAYASLREMWREWGRSFDLKDDTKFTRRWLDVLHIWLTMALPAPLLVALLSQNSLREVIAQPDVVTARASDFASTLTAPTLFSAIVGINALLLCIRIAMMFAIRGSYAERGWTFWLSWLADVPAAVRLTMSTARRPRVWRGRMYDPREQYQA